MQRNRTDFVILGMLSIQSNKTGYDLRKAVEGSVGYFWGESYGQIYPALKRLAAAGLIVPSQSPAAAKQRRQEYSLTQAGHACLREWLAAPVQNDPPRNEFLLKLFFGRQAAPGVPIGHLRRLQENNRAMLTALLQLETMAVQQSSQNPHMPYWMLTLRLGIAQTRTALEWGESALATLSSAESAAAANPHQADNNPAADGA
jgi:PadR family transcriptional regulator, regulatory protein AphA